MATGFSGFGGMSTGLTGVGRGRGYAPIVAPSPSLETAPPVPDAAPGFSTAFERFGGFAGATTLDFSDRISTRKCRKCNSMGHFARDCTQGGGTSGNEGICGSATQQESQTQTAAPVSSASEAQTNQSAPRPTTQPIVTKSCYKCGGKDHTVRDCPETRRSNEQATSNTDLPNEQSQFSGFGGGRMGGVGRGWPLAPSPPVVRRTLLNTVDLEDEDDPVPGGGVRRDTCHTCGLPGHFSRECPQRGERGGRRNEREIRCRRCGGMGHRAIDCDRPAEAQKCFNCGDTGHLLAECPHPRQGTSGSGKPFPVKYIPEELTDEALFEGAIAPGENFDRLFEPRVQLSGSAHPPKMKSFVDGGFSEQLLENIKRADYKTPTPIQGHGIPVVQSGRDIMGCAQTGSGKTAAYLLPILNAMLMKNEGVGDVADLMAPVCIILAPTRELAVQILREAKKFAFGTVIKAQVVYGGVAVQHQVEKLKEGCGLLVATPGRIMQFVRDGNIGLNKVRWLVLDEADRMLDLGFEPDIRSLVRENDMPDKTSRQTLMFSATFPTPIQNLAKDFLRDFCFVTVGKVGGANTDISQTIEIVTQNEKKDLLSKKLAEDMANAVDESGCFVKKTLVFVERKRVADFLAARLSLDGYQATTIHGDRYQYQREEALGEFKSGKIPILIATAVASRGLDIKNVDHVINVDLPQTIEDYVHRIGRTGRVGNRGRATSFYEPSTDLPIARDLCGVLADAKQTVPDWLLQEAQQTKPSPGQGWEDEMNEGAVGGNEGPTFEVDEWDS